MPCIQPDRNITHLEATRCDDEGQRAERGVQSPPIPRPQVGCREQLDDTTSEPDGLMHLRGAEDARYKENSKRSGLLQKIRTPAGRHGVAEVQPGKISERFGGRHRGRTQSQTRAMVLNPMEKFHPSRLIQPGHFEMPQTCCMKLLHLLQ